RATPAPDYVEAQGPQRRYVHGHAVVTDVSADDRVQPLAQFGDGFVHAPPKFGFHRVHLRLQPFAIRLPQHRKPSIAPLLYANVRKAEKVERLRFPFSTPLPVVDRVWTELQQARFLRMQLQVELPHSLGQLRPKLLGIRFHLEAKHDVVSETNYDHIAVRPLPTPRLGPQVEHIMKIDVSQQRRSTSALGRTFLHSYPFPFLQHARIDPFLAQPPDAPVCYPI